MIATGFLLMLGALGALLALQLVWLVLTLVFFGIGACVPRQEPQRPELYAKPNMTYEQIRATYEVSSKPYGCR